MSAEKIDMFCDGQLASGQDKKLVKTMRVSMHAARLFESLGATESEALEMVQAAFERQQRMRLMAKISSIKLPKKAEGQ